MLERAVAYSEICAAIQHLEDALEMMHAIRDRLEAGPWSPGDIIARQAAALAALEKRVETLEKSIHTHAPLSDFGSLAAIPAGWMIGEHMSRGFDAQKSSPSL